MKCGVKFCGGCNPRYARGDAYRKIREDLPEVDFRYAEEEEPYDQLLVIGGCPACCASHSQYTVRDEMRKMWSEEHIEDIERWLLDKSI